MKRRYWIIALVAIAALGGAGYAYQQSRAQTAAASKTTTVAKPILALLANDVASLAPIEIAQVLVATGSIKALNQAQVKSQVSAAVVAVNVQEGQAVKAGQVLASTDAQDYQTRLGGAQAALAQAQSQQAIAQRALDNNKALVDKGFVSATVLDTAAQQLDASKAAVKVAQSNIDLAQKALKDTLITSPIAGVVTEKLISAGDKVSPDMKVFTITQPGAVEFEGSLPAAEAAQLQVGQAITVDTEGMPSLNARITRLGAAVNTATRSVGFFAALKPTASAAQPYRPGSYATGKVQVKAQQALAVPTAALREEGGRSVLYTITAGNELVSSPVTVGLRGEDASGNSHAVIDGLPAGTRYIARNLGPLRTGSAVTIGAPQ